MDLVGDPFQAILKVPLAGERIDYRHKLRRQLKERWMVRVVNRSAGSSAVPGEVLASVGTGLGGVTAGVDGSGG